ncbi:MAG: WYL domain-containing protein [Pirellulales bacterium]|nr:WYL domain-containing protein [Pirellulales bacterium]
MNLTRIHRLLNLIGLLQAGKGFNVDGLAQECGVSKRTIFRDLELLRASNLPLLFDEERQQYRMGSSVFLPATNFTPDEALALIVLCHELGDRSGLPFLHSARSAAMKLESTLPGRLRDRLREIAPALHIQREPANPLEGKRPVYEQLVEALGKRRCVRIRYRSLHDGGEIRTKLSPYRMFFSRRSWYVVGRSSLHRETRTFNLGRVAEIETLDHSYEIPRGFSVERFLRNAWHLIPEPGPDRQVVVRFGAQVAQNVAEVNWHKTQQLQFNADGTLDFSVTVSGLNEISWWIHGYGDQAEVLEPPELRKLIAKRIERLATMYGKDGRGGHED